jgi:hypothetical protein
MADPEDIWPLPEYNVGSHYHLHALGVIAVAVAAFERNIDDLYTFHPQRHKVPAELINLYFNLDEEKRLGAIRKIYDAYENDGAVRAIVNNILDPTSRVSKTI